MPLTFFRNHFRIELLMCAAAPKSVSLLFRNIVMHKYKFILFPVLCLCFPFTAAGMTLPAGTEEVCEGAFENCSSIEEVLIPEGTVRVNDSAFSGCSSLKKVTLPASLENIGNDCFDGCAEALCFSVPADCPAAQWVRSSGFDYSADTVCRALIIGQTYSGTVDALYGTANDARAMRFCLSQMKNRHYEIDMSINLSAQGILDAISSSFEEAGEDDISLFFYSGHGDIGGKLVGNDLEMITPSQLRAALDRIPGRKIIIVDACYSGSLIEDVGAGSSLSVSSADLFPQNFTESFTSAFRPRLRSAFGGTSQYYVMTAARADQTSEEDSIYSGGSSRNMGFFTYSLCRGCGWDGVAFASTDMAADVNEDGAITWAEAFEYTTASVLHFTDEQQAVVYPQNCTAFAPFRP